MPELTLELRTAAESDDVEAIDALIEAGADPNAKNHAGNTALHAAAYQGSVGAIRALLAAGEADDASVRSLGHARDVVPPRVAQNPAPVLDVARAGQAKKRPVRNQPGIGVTPRLDLDVGDRGGVR